MRTFRLAAAILAGAVLLSAQANWPNPGNDPGGMKYSTLAQITPANVHRLVKAWTYDTGEHGGGFRGWEVTPLVINGVMYFSTMDGKLTALNAATGAPLWTFDAKAVSPTSRFAARGISYWPGDAQMPAAIVAATSDGYLIQVDLKTGKLAERDGQPWVVDLRMKKYGNFYPTAAMPAIYKNLAIVIPETGEQGRYGHPGDPRAFNLDTGKQVWRFHTVPRPGEPNFGTWGANGWQDRLGPGGWVPMTVDTVRGLVFIPLGNATDQNYGGSRPGTDLYSTSLICLNAETGKLVWYQQLTHHDIFDYDVNAPPTLIEVRQNGKEVPAVAQSLKQGLLYIFNRLTGESLFGMEERPAPATDAPGDSASPIQPFPQKPLPISRLAMTRDQVSRISPAATKSCEAQYDKAVQEGPDTPYLMEPSLTFPSSEGGGSWSGASFDPALGYIFVNTRDLGTMAQLFPTLSSGVLPSYAKRKIPFNDPEGYPCSAPPWGELMAINASTGDFVWRVPLGEYKQLTARGVPITGTANAGGPIVTAGGVLFIGSTADYEFRAFDPKTGKQIWSTPLENMAIATPMTYLADGHQYVATVEGGGLEAFAQPALTAAERRAKPVLVVAYALPGGVEGRMTHALPPPVGPAAAAPATAMNSANSAAAATLPPGNGRDLVAQTCNLCHGLEVITSMHQDKDGWTATVNQMVNQGAQLTDPQILTVADYLTRNFGTGKKK
ncbi:MAG TPA: PQQ-binding-like beta-propeller repeat protein [Terriglobales bacterium]|nr:PQQ-binding-like beta-propeller repeat protein [Terriglobales bacterium]